MWAEEAEGPETPWEDFMKETEQPECTEGSAKEGQWAEGPLALIQSRYPDVPAPEAWALQALEYGVPTPDAGATLSITPAKPPEDGYDESAAAAHSGSKTCELLPAPHSSLGQEEEGRSAAPSCFWDELFSDDEDEPLEGSGGGNEPRWGSAANLECDSGSKHRQLSKLELEAANKAWTRHVQSLHACSPRSDA